MQNPAPSPIHVYFALLPGSLVLDWAGPAEALRIANQTLAKQGQPERFVQHFVSPTPESVSSVGAVLTRLEPLPATLPRPTSTTQAGVMPDWRLLMLKNFSSPMSEPKPASVTT